MSEIRILIVEDEPLIAHDIAGTLEKYDYCVSAIVYSPAKAKYQLEHHLPDLVLLDINLGYDVDGIQLGDWIRKQYMLPFIYLTSYADARTLEQAKSTFPMGYLVKPFDDRELFAAIEIALYNFAHFQFPLQFDLERINRHLLSKLTRKEFELLQDLYEGKTYLQMTEKHFISLNTVKTHIKHIYDKLGVGSRAESLGLIRQYLA